MKFLRRFSSRDIVATSSGGGHLAELRASLPNSATNRIVYITSRNRHTYESLSSCKRYFIVDPHNSKFKYLVNFFQAFFLFLILRPRLIISTGAGISIPFMMIGKFFGSKVVFIETGARIYSTSKTGKFMYQYADRFFVQYETLLEKYPKATLGSLR